MKTSGSGAPPCWPGCGRFGTGAPLDRFLGYADAMLDEKEFFIRKAIGWVLREVGKRRPEEVSSWLAPRTHRASGVTMREATKYLPDADRERLWMPTASTCPRRTEDRTEVRCGYQAQKAHAEP